MKLKEIKKVLVGKIDSYTTLTKEEENDEVYEVEYSLDLVSRGNEYNFLTVIFEDSIFKNLQDLEVNGVYCNNNGFVIELSGKETYKLLKDISRQYQLPLITKRYIITN